MQGFTILLAFCCSLLFAQISFAQNSAIQHYQTGKSYEQKAKFKKAFKHYQIASDLGLVDAQISLASFYETGLGVEESLPKTFQIYQKAASQNNLFAQYKVARSYETGRGVQKNIPKAIYYYLILWEKDYPKAKIALKNLTIDQSSDKEHFAYIHYKAEQGLVKYECKLGKEYLKLQEFKKAQFWLEKAAKKKHLIAQATLADLYIEGKVLEKNTYRAIKYYVQAANQGDKKSEEKVKKFNLKIWLSSDNVDYLIYKSRNGDAFCQFNLSQLYQKGGKVEKNELLAFSYCKEAAQQGHQKAIRQLAQMYQEGIGTSPNPEKSFAYSEILAKLGYPKAQQKVGDYYLKNKEYHNAASWYLKASKEILIEIEIKFKENPFLLNYANKKSEDYLLFKAQNGDTQSQYNLAVHYFEQGETKGLDWLFKAAEAGSQEANLLLGEIYLEGDKLPKDIKKACEAFAKAELTAFQIKSKYKDICTNLAQSKKNSDLEH